MRESTGQGGEGSGDGSEASPCAGTRQGAYYNEFDPKAAAWLRELIAQGHISQGEVDERSIVEIQSGDIPSRAHFFAGIGGWEEALRLAGWPADRPVWTGSCPCQPFSAAGKRKGVEDERHLWPEFLRLIAERRPPTIFGEQVASADGRLWLAGVRSDLEALGYAVGASDLCSAGVGSPNIRQRLYWVAVSEGERCDGRESSTRPNRRPSPQDGGSIGGLGSAESLRLEGWRDGGERLDTEPFGLLLAGPGANAGGLGFWSGFDILPCLDGKARRIEPGSFPLAHGVPGRVGLLRGYGNAINPYIAAEFIAAYLETENAPPGSNPGDPTPC